MAVPAVLLAAALACPASFAHTDRDPVLLVHGTGQTASENWDWNYGRVLPRRGLDVCEVTLPDRSYADIQVASEYVANAVREMHARSGRKVDTIGHSQGTLEQRWPVRFAPDVQQMVDDEILLSGPGHGTMVGNAACAAGLCAPALWQMRMGSRFERALNAGDETPGPADVTSIYSTVDDLVQPPSTAVIAGAQNILMQDVCAGRIVHHGGSLFDSLTFELVTDALDHAGPAQPSRLAPGACGRQVMPGAVDVLANDVGVYARGVESLAVYPMVAAEPAPRAMDPAPARFALRLQVAPRAIRAGRRMTVRVRVFAGDAPFARARVTMAGRAARTATNGYARLRVTVRRRGSVRVSATAAGYQPAQASLAVR
jgi:hypothetical protein